MSYNSIHTGAEIDDAVTKVKNGLPITNGGTGADNVADARQNINYIGVNPIASINDDTPANWAALGTGVAYINKDLLNNQPYSYGFLENRVHNGLVSQTFHAMDGKSPVWHRSGNSSGWYSGSANWVKSLDENSGIQIKKLWENASPTSAFSNQTINLDMTGYSLIKIQFNLDTNKRALPSFDSPTGRACFYESRGYTRHFAISTDKITFTDASNAGAIIPSVIYGIKGVL